MKMTELEYRERIPNEQYPMGKMETEELMQNICEARGEEIYLVQPERDFYFPQWEYNLKRLRSDSNSFSEC